MKIAHPFERGNLMQVFAEILVYKRVAALEEDDVVRLRKERKTLNSGNLLQAILNFVAAALMTFAFAG